MTSRKLKTPSTEEQDGLNTDSVFDFLYYDARRIASFLSQFDSSGQLKEIVQNESAQGSKRTTGTIKAVGGVPLIATAEGEKTSETGAGFQHESQRVYDPIWANARTFLDYLSEREMIHRNVAEANMGQFVLCSGSLSITDLQLMERTWKLRSVQTLIKAGQQPAARNRRERRAQNVSNSPTTDNLDLVIDLLSIMPHTIQAKISGAANVWCSLSQDGMSTLASDITLKHGTQIPGEWYALGILDAKPERSAYTEEEPDFSDGQEIAAKMMTLLGPTTKNLLGRPEGYFGITPLLIFREVVGV